LHVKTKTVVAKEVTNKTACYFFVAFAVMPATVAIYSIYKNLLTSQKNFSFYAKLAAKQTCPDHQKQKIFIKLHLSHTVKTSRMPPSDLTSTPNFIVMARPDSNSRTKRMAMAE
jgi:hypothetical protein